MRRNTILGCKIVLSNLKIWTQEEVLLIKSRIAHVKRFEWIMLLSV